MKKILFLSFILYVAAFIPVFGQEEYTLLCSGDDRGTVTIHRNREGKITITGRIAGAGPRMIGTVEINHAICPLIPMGQTFNFMGNSRSIIIDGNTTTITKLDGSWQRRVVNGNTTAITYSNGSWERKVVNGNTTTITYSFGVWSKTVVDKQGHTIYITTTSGRT
jgi:hypothetical protein